MNSVLKFKKIFFLYIFFLKIYLLPQRIYFYSQNKFEINIISKSLNSYDRVVGVYDLNVYKEPFSVGEFCYFIFFLDFLPSQIKKYLFILLRKIKIIRILKDIYLLKMKKIYQFFFLISKVLIGKKLIEIDYISWEQFKKKF